MKITQDIIDENWVLKEATIVPVQLYIQDSFRSCKLILDGGSYKAKSTDPFLFAEVEDAQENNACYYGSGEGEFSSWVTC